MTTDIILVLLGFIMMIIGLVGSFLPIIPGPPFSWLGLLLLYLTKAIPEDWTMLGITLAIAILVFIFDYFIPILGTKKFGGSKYGILGTTLGLLFAIFFPIFGIFGIIIWPFVGAFIGEFVYKSNERQAIKAAFGSFLGFLMGTFLKFVVAVVYFIIFLKVTYDHIENLFPYFF